MGSGSDSPAMRGAAEVLEKLQVPFEVEVTSAHRSPDRTRHLVRSAAERGVKVFIVGAGGAAHLAGSVAALTTLPVLGVPLASTPLGGLDALLATVQMPAGVPVGTLAIGAAGARNAAFFAAAILAVADPGLAGRLEAWRAETARDIEKSSRNLSMRRDPAGD
ncbi:MAG: 5-(carboxyamino)imidazole ribonucleotide mutase [Acidobacteriota bacterium]